jgi:hypothetical protein
VIGGADLRTAFQRLKRSFVQLGAHSVSIQASSHGIKMNDYFLCLDDTYNVINEPDIATICEIVR